MSDTHFTPAHVLTGVRNVFQAEIDLDPCTTADNPVQARMFHTEATNGLAASWSRSVNIFLNPPFSEPAPWIDKLTGSGVPAISLTILGTLANKSTAGCLARADAYCFPSPRLKFTGNGSASFDTVIALHSQGDGAMLARFVKEFSSIGQVSIIEHIYF